MSVVVLDLETTGLDSATDAVVEIAAVPLEHVAIPPQFKHAHEPYWDVGPGTSSLVAPGRRVPPAARAVHHLGDAELRTAPHLRDAMEECVGWGCGVELNDPEYSDYTVACHHADFDRGFVGKFFHGGVKWLCTWRLSQHLYPDADSHSNQALRYYLPGVDDDFNAWQIKNNLAGAAPHRALYDAGVTAHILKRMLSEHPLEYLMQLQSQPVLQRTVRFGKHRGTPWTNVPRDYCNWVLRADPPFDNDVRHTARHWLNN